MKNENAKSELALQKLGQRLQEGWEKLHPVTQKDLVTMHEAIQSQREEIAWLKRRPSPTTGKKLARSKSQQGKEKKSDQTKSKGPGHSH